MPPPPDRRSLLDLALAARSSERHISDRRQRVAIGSLAGLSFLGQANVEDLRDRTVLFATQPQFVTVMGLIQLDGIAKRVLLATPDLAPHLPAIARDAEVDFVVADGETQADFAPMIRVSDTPTAAAAPSCRACGTEWVLFTSGTTGRPKMVVHTLESLSGPLDDGVVHPSGAVWSTFYDVRRYGGLQILLRALIGGGSMVLSDAGEPMAAFLRRAAQQGITHISGTPSHWRQALMSGAAGIISPAYVRLSGEVADQPILDALRAAFPKASIAHAFASTEAGVAFDVRDGLAGFPAALLGEGSVHTRIADGRLWVRSSRNASRYLGEATLARSADGFIDTGDLVEQVGDRVYFRGRREGVINVGGQKVYPEEVEAVLLSHPDVRVARVWPRKNPITGAVVAADVVVAGDERSGFDALRDDLLRLCRSALAKHKVPVSIRQVDHIALTPSGKVVRGA